MFSVGLQLRVVALAKAAGCRARLPEAGVTSRFPQRGCSLVRIIAFGARRLRVTLSTS